MEDNDQQPPPPQPPIQNNDEKPSSKYKILGIINIIFGFIQIPVPIILVFIVIPQLTILYKSLNIKQPSLIPTYAVLIFLIVLGLINISIGVKLFLKSTQNKEKYFTIGIVAIILIFLSAGSSMAITVTSIITPIYKLTSEIDSSPSPTIFQTPSPTPTINISDTSTWKTYTNNQFNFELKLPEDIQIKENQAGSNFIRFSNAYKWEDKKISVDTKQYLDIFLFVSTVSPQTNLKGWILEDAIRPMPNGKTESQIKGEVQQYREGSIDGYWYVGVVEEEDKYIVFKKDDKIFKFRLGGYQTGSSYKDNKNAEVALNQILSTFKFTN